MLDKLQLLKKVAITSGKLEELEIKGLILESALVFPSGLAILIAIFVELKIDHILNKLQDARQDRERGLLFVSSAG